MLKIEEVLAAVTPLLALVPDVTEVRVSAAAEGRWRLFCDIGGKTFEADDATSYHKLVNFIQGKIPATVTT